MRQKASTPVDEEKSQLASNWADRYMNTMKRYQDSEKKRGNSWTMDVSGGTQKDIRSLIQDYDTIRDYAAQIGGKEFYNAYSDLVVLDRYIDSKNREMGQFDSDESYQTAIRQAGWNEKYRGQDWQQLQESAKGIEDKEEREYVQNLSAWSRQEYLRGFDTAKAEEEIAELQRQIDRIYEATDFTLSSSRIAADESADALDKKITALQKEINEARNAQKADSLSGVGNQESKYYDRNFDSMSGYSGRKGLSQYINETEQERSQRQAQENIWGESGYTRKNYDRLNEDEKKVFNYWDNYDQKNGTNKAQEFLDSIQETLNYRKGQEINDSREGKSYLYDLALATAAGIDQWQTGASRFGAFLTGNEEYTPATANQIALGMAVQDAAENGHKIPLGEGEDGQKTWEQFGLESAASVGNMLPSMVTSFALGAILPGVGLAAGTAANLTKAGSLAVMGAGIAGNTYTEAINQGYSADKAKAYAFTQAASEIATEYLFGGIEKMTGIGTDALQETLLKKLDRKNIDKAILRFCVRVGTDALGESFEEGIQGVIEPWLTNITLDQDNKVYTGDVLYQMLCGFATSTVMSGPQIGIEEYGTYRTGKKAMDSGVSIDTMKGIGETFRSGDVYELSKKINDKTGAYTIGRYMNAIGASLSDQNVSDITNYLLNKGLPMEVARHNAQLLNYIAMGGELSSQDMKTVNADEILADAFREMVLNKDSDVSKRTEGYQSILKGMNGETKANATEVWKAEERENAELGERVVSDPNRAALAVESLDGDTMQVRMKDGSVADSTIAQYGTGEEALLFETARKFGGDTAGANRIANGFDSETGLSMREYCKGVEDSYRYGKFGFDESELKRGMYASQIDAASARSAYQAGIRDARLETARKQAQAMANRKSGQEAALHFDRKGRKFNAKQETAISTMDQLSKAFGVDFWVFESYEKNGKRMYVKADGTEAPAPNGWYDENGIHIDLNAGKDGRGVMLYTLGHELTHHIRKNSPEKFKAFADLVMENYGKIGVSADKLVQEQIAKAKRNGRDIGYEEAYEEVIADSMEGILADGKVLQLVNKLQETDASLGDKVRKWFADAAEKIRSIVEAYKNERPDSWEGQMVANMKEILPQLEELYAEGLVDAGKKDGLTPGEDGTVVNDAGEPVAESRMDGSALFSIRTYEDDGRKALRDYLEKCVSGNRITKTEMQEMIDGIEDIYNVCKSFTDKYAPFGAWSDASVVMDTYGRPVFSVVTPNGEYKMNLDFSLVCKKRRTLDAVFNEMSRRGIIDDFELGQKSVVKINEIIRKHGFETACALCFVDAKRFRQASMADSFTNLYNELVYSLVPEDRRDSIDHFNFAGYETIKKIDGGIDTWDTSKLDFSHVDDVLKSYGKGTVEYKAAMYIKTHPEGRKLLLRGDFMSSHGFDAVKTQNKDILKLYNSKKGAGGPKAAFGDVQYLNEIIRKEKTWTPAKAYAVGGVRIQSFSDYVPRMVFDYTQMIYDLAATKLPAHAYTKEDMFAKQFGLTGVKINMSLIPAVEKNGIAPGLDANGNYVWAGESFDFETAKQIQSAEGYTENCGTICVGVSDLHIRKLLNDPDIRMVIPYHKSGLNPIVAHMNRVSEFTDYTGSQNTLDRNGKKLSKDFDFNRALHKMGDNGDPKSVIREYLDWCDRNGYTPRFSQFRDHPNYYKLIEDFTLYDRDGRYVPQREVRAVFPSDGSAFGSMKTLIELGLQEDAIIEGKRDRSLSSIVDEIERTLPKSEADIPETEVVQADRDLESTATDIVQSAIHDAGVKYSERVTDKDSDLPYSYENFVSKPDMVVTIIDGNVPNNRADVVYQAKQNAAKIGKFNTKDGSVIVFVKDIGKDVVLGTAGLKHSLDRRFELNAPVTLKAGEIISNSIKINELTPQKNEADESYVLIGASRGANGELYVVRSVVNKFSSELSSMDVLYAINAKKGNRLRSMRPGFQGPVTDSTISISELLDYVNDYFPDILPEDVLKHYGHTARPEGKLGESALYSDRDQNVQEANRILQKQNDELKGLVSELREIVRLQGRTTNGTVYTRGSIEAAGRKLMRMAGAKGDVTELSVILSECYSSMAEGSEDMVSNAQKAAQWLVEHKSAAGEDAGLDAASVNEQMMNVYESFTGLIPIRTVADKYQWKIDALKGKYNRKIQEIRSKYSQELAELKKKRAEDIQAVRQQMQETSDARQKAVMEDFANQKSDLQAAREDTRIMEREFIRLAREYEKTSKAGSKADAERMEFKDALKAEASRHKQDNALWEQEFRRLSREYEKAGKSIDKLQVQLEKTRASASARVESRKQTAARNQIKDIHAKLQKMILSPAKADTMHAPVGLTRAVADVCDLFVSNMEQAGQRRSGEYDSRIDQAQAKLDAKPGLKGAAAQVDTAKRQKDRIANTAQKLKAMRDQYKAIEKDGALGIYYDENVAGMIAKLSEDLSGKDIYQMTSDELEQVKNTMTAIYHTVVNANRVFSMGKDKTLIGTAKQLGKEISDVNVEYIQKYLPGAGRYLNWQMNPDTFFDALCGFAKDNTGREIQKMFQKGNERMLSVQRDYYNMTRHITENKDYQKELAKTLGNPTKNMVDWGLRDSYGDAVKTSRGFMIQAYMLLTQEDSLNSLVYGGFKIPRQEVYYKDRSKAFGDMDEGRMLSMSPAKEIAELDHQIKQIQEALKSGELKRAEFDQATIALDQMKAELESVIMGEKYRLLEIRDRIEAMLTPCERDCVDTARQWYAYSGKLMADVFEEMYGYRPNLVGNYVEIHRDLTNVKTDIRETDGAFNLENSGFTKERVKSTAPILLTDFFVELESQKNKMSRYYGFTQAQKDFGRIWKVRMPGGRSTVESKVAAKFGTGNTGLGVSGVQYVENYIKSMAGSTEKNSGVFDKFYSAAASKTLSLNPRVAVSQLASIPTAAAVVGWKNMAVGLPKGLATAVSRQKKNALAQKNVYFFQRYRGEGGIVEMADLRTSGGIWNRIASSNAGKLLFNWCQSMDVFATATMYSMAEEAAKSRGYTPGSQEFDAAANEIYTEIIRKTQPNYTVTERSDMLRDQRAGMKLINMYKTQPNQNFNLLLQSAGRLAKAKRDVKTGANGVTAADVTAAAKDFANSATAVIIGGNITFVLLRTAVNLLMADVKGYRDEETGEKSEEKIRDAMFREFLSSMSGMFALGGQLYDIIYSVACQENYYGLTDSAISVVGGVLEQGVKLFQKIRSDDPEDQVTAEDWLKFTGKALGAIGVPYDNAKKFLEAARQWKYDLDNGSLGKYANRQTTDRQFRNRFVEAYRNGDEDTCNDILAILAANLEAPNDRRAQKDVRSGFRSHLKEQYLKGKVTEEEVRGIMTEYLDADSGEVDAMLNSWKGITETGKTLEKYQEAYLYEEVSSEDYIRYLTTYSGKTREEAEKAELRLRCERDTGYAYDEIREKYIDQEISGIDAASWMETYGGLEAEEAETKLKEYDFEREYGYSWDDRADAYRNGDITRQELKYALMDISGKRAGEADSYLEDLDFEQKYGFKYSERVQKYLDGTLSRDQLRRLLIEHDGMFRAKAEQELTYYDWYKAHPNTKLKFSEVSQYVRTVENAGTSLYEAGISEDLFIRYKTEKNKCKGVDEDNDGVADSGSKQAQILPIIDALPITEAQKDVLWFHNGWSKKTLNRKAPWKK